MIRQHKLVSSATTILRAKGIFAAPQKVFYSGKLVNSKPFSTDDEYTLSNAIKGINQMQQQFRKELQDQLSMSELDENEANEYLTNADKTILSKEWETMFNPKNNGMSNLDQIADPKILQQLGLNNLQLPSLKNDVHKMMKEQGLDPVAFEAEIKQMLQQGKSNKQVALPEDNDDDTPKPSKGGKRKT